MADDDAQEVTEEEGPEVLTPHVFKAGEDGETCAECGRFADDHLHSPASITAHENASWGTQEEEGE